MGNISDKVKELALEGAATGVGSLAAFSLNSLIGYGVIKGILYLEPLLENHDLLYSGSLVPGVIAMIATIAGGTKLGYSIAERMNYGYWKEFIWPSAGVGMFSGFVVGLVGNPLLC